MKKALVIGHFDWKNNHMIGAVVKARCLLDEMRNNHGFKKVNSFDIFNWKKRTIIVFIKLVLVLFFYKDIFLVISDTSSKITTLFRIYWKLFKKRFYFITVGASIGDTLKKNPNRINKLSFIDSFFVETNDCLNTMKELNINNVYLMRNFKQLTPVACSKSFDDKKTYRFCTMSRVNYCKGITHAINAINHVNSELSSYLCYLDIYGEIESEYKKEFEDLLKDNKHVRYLGVALPNETVNILKDYDCLLFPTLYETEGIPGTIVDAFASALPIICSNWKRCCEIVENNKNGIVYDFGDFEGLVKSIELLIENPKLSVELSKNCLMTYDLYKPEVAIIPLLNRIKMESKK